MRCGLCGFLIIKPQTALHHAVWCGAVMIFCERFWCGFCGLVNTPTFMSQGKTYVLSCFNKSQPIKPDPLPLLHLWRSLKMNGLCY